MIEVVGRSIVAMPFAVFITIQALVIALSALPGVHSGIAVEDGNRYPRRTTKIALVCGAVVVANLGVACSCFAAGNSTQNMRYGLLASLATGMVAFQAIRMLVAIRRVG